MKIKGNVLKKTSKSTAFNFIGILPVLLILVSLAISVFVFIKIARPQKVSSRIPPDVKDYLAKQSPSAKIVTFPVPSTIRVPILLFHYVEYVRDRGDTIRISLDITPNLFDEEVKTLKEANYTFITASELSDMMDGKVKIPQKPIMLTFDDGYRDFYTDVFPILKKYSVKAVAYVVSGFLDKPNNMTTQMVQEVADSGLVEIGAHTVDHWSLKGLPEQKSKYEVVQSKLALEQITGKPVGTFAYPNGSFDIQAIKVVQEAGFKTGVTTVSGADLNPNERLVLPRVRTGNRIGQALLNFLGQKTFEPIIYPSPAPTPK